MVDALTQPGTESKEGSKKSIDFATLLDDSAGIALEEIIEGRVDKEEVLQAYKDLNLPTGNLEKMIIAVMHTYLMQTNSLNYDKDTLPAVINRRIGHAPFDRMLRDLNIRVTMQSGFAPIETYLRSLNF